IKPSTGRPSTKANTAGIDCTRIWLAISGFWSISTFTNLILPLASRTSFSRVGVRALQGPHHGAQKSTRTGTDFEASITSAAKVLVVESLIRSWLVGVIAKVSMIASI